jgi:hypothetical protein
MTSSNSFAGQLADAITNTDRMQAEARELLGFAPDVALLPAEALRVQVVMALRTVIFDQLDGKGVDPARLLATAEALARLLPAPPPTPAQTEREHSGAHEKLRQLIEAHASEYQDELAESRAEIERLQAALRQRADAAQPVQRFEPEILPPEPKPAQPAPEQQPQQPAATAQ